MLCHREWLAPSTTLPPKMARGIRRTVYMNTSRCQRFISNCFQKFILARPNSHSNYKLKLLIARYIHLFIDNYFFSCLGCWQMKQYIFEEYFHQWLSVLNARGARATIKILPSLGLYFKITLLTKWRSVYLSLSSNVIFSFWMESYCLCHIINFRNSPILLISLTRKFIKMADRID